jgi:hypothetical protein
MLLKIILNLTNGAIPAYSLTVLSCFLFHNSLRLNSPSPAQAYFIKLVPEIARIYGVFAAWLVLVVLESK